MARLFERSALPGTTTAHEDGALTTLEMSYRMNNALLISVINRNVYFERSSPRTYNKTTGPNSNVKRRPRSCHQDRRGDPARWERENRMRRKQTWY
eukprot:4536589-Pyramimonas_sp.AAC.1